jgi:hypothetical protein
MRLVVGLGIAASGLLSALPPPAELPPIGLRHVPVAVADLNRAASDFERLGFALKVGRPHDDGIVNRHAKFTDGTEVELITAPAATDALTGHYRRRALRTRQLGVPPRGRLAGRAVAGDRDAVVRGARAEDGPVR